MLKTTTGAAKSFGMHDSAPSVGRSPSLEHMGWFQIPERSTTSFQAHYLQQLSLQDWQKNITLYHFAGVVHGLL